MNNNMLSQEEIDALLNGNSDDDVSDSQIDESNNNDIMLTEEEVDALGEIGNISMGTAATTLFTLLGQKVTITTPKVSTTNMKELAKNYPSPYIAVDVKYKVGLEGSNLLILKTNDVKVITDLMMGGDGKNVDRELNDMDFSAISEAMNQMVGSSSTSLSEMFNQKIDIDPPRAFKIEFDKDVDGIETLSKETQLVKISFRMIIGDIIDSEIMQLLPLNFAKDLFTSLFDKDIEESESLEYNNQENAGYNVNIKTEYDTYKNDNVMEVKSNDKVEVEKFNFKNFESNNDKRYNESIDLIQDIPIEITVELGRTIKKISEVLEYGPGTIIELDKLVGEPLDIKANGRIIAKGEVVVIDDNFGIRVTDILSSSKTIKKL